MADQLPNSHVSRRHLRTALVYYWKMIDVVGPAESIVVPSVPPPRPRWLTFDDADALATVARRIWPEGAVVMLGLYAGFRRAEIAGARWEWFDRDWSMVSIIGKGGHTRHVPVHPDLLVWLRPHRVHGPLFPGHRDRVSVSTTTINNWFDAVATRAGVEATPHQLRHTFAQTLYQATGDIYLVQSLLGHAKVETTMRYVGVTAAQKQDAIRQMRSFGGSSRAAK